MNFKIYRSSAGSGKTFTLTKEYLKLALTTPLLGQGFSPNYFRNILAVTFTNFAANEMKERILKQLSIFSKLDADETNDMLAMIEAEIREEYPQLKLKREDLCERSKEIHETLLHNYSDFSVSTIDSFNNRIVQSFTKDLGLPYNYEIELETEELLEEAKDRLQNAVGKEESKELTELLVEFALRKADEGNSWYIDQDLADFGKNLFNEDKYEVIKALKDLEIQDFKQIKTKLFAYLKKVESQVATEAQKALDTIASSSLKAADFHQKARGIYGYFQKHAQQKEPLFKLNANSYARKSIEEDKWLGAKPSAAKEIALDAIKGTLEDAFLQIEAIKEREMPDYIVTYSLQKTIYLLATINEMEKELNALKEDKGVVHISDFNVKINEIVETEPVPYIYERLGERYHHILIDEFQDTSKMQWHNLIPLVTNALAKDLLNMVVGDAKQAIYRWRGGKSEMLVSLPKVPTLNEDSPLQYDVQIFGSQENIQNLQRNFRSRENIIAFNNNFFAFAKGFLSDTYPDLKDYYGEVVQKENKKVRGKVELDLFPPNSRSQYEKEMFARVWQIIENLKSSESFNPSDIAILTRNNKDGVFLAEQLMEVGQAVISSESLLLVNASTTRFLVDFIRALASPSNPSLKMSLILAIVRHNNRIKNEEFQLSGEQYIHASQVAENEDVNLFLNLIDDFFQIKIDPDSLQFLSLYEVAEDLIRHFELFKIEEEQVYIQKLLDLILSYSLRNGNRMLDFIEYWDHRSDKFAISTPNNEQAVRIMSIHKSKGLQFPVVIVPFANWSTKPHKSEKIWRKWEGNPIASQLRSIILNLSEELSRTSFSADYQAEMEAAFLDAFNLLYVALTRPESQLYILSLQVDKAVTLDKLNAINQIFALYLQFLKDEEREIDQEEATVYLPNSDRSSSYLKVLLYDEAEETVKEKQEETVSTDLHLSQFLHTQMRDQLRLRRNDLRADDQKITLKDVFSRRKKGVLLHYAFEKVEFLDDIPKALEEMEIEGWISSEEMGELQTNMEAVLTLPTIRSYYERKAGLIVQNEREILVNSDKGSQSFRPDRVVIDGGKAAIIDYKTGVENNEKYAKQLENYAFHYQTMGFVEVRKFIVYTDPEMRKVVEV